MNRHKKHHRRRDGVRLSAAVTLCLAASLLLFSRAGGEPLARQAVAALAGNTGFVARAVSLELGLSPSHAEIYTPRKPQLIPNRKAPTCRRKAPMMHRC